MADTDNYRAQTRWTKFGRKLIFSDENQNCGGVEPLGPGAVVEARKARVDMYKGSMRLAGDKWGTLKAAESPADFKVKEDNNVSLVEFELITVMQ